MRRNGHCALTREGFHGYLDGVLPDAEAREVAAHLERCTRCREELAQFRVLREALRSLPSAAGSESARDRVFARYRGTTQPRDADDRLLQPSGWAPAYRWSRHPSLSFALAAAAAMLIAFLTPVSPGRGKKPLLPGPAEMSVLSQRHDLHVAHAVGKPGTQESPGRAGAGARGDE